MADANRGRVPISRVLIDPATLRDASFVAHNMRQHDWNEIQAQVRDGTTALDIALWALSGREAWVATWRGQPVAVFGLSDLTPAGNVAAVWAWGTADMRRAVPEVTRFIRTVLVPRWILEGVTRVEARSIADHAEAHRWMSGLGGKAEPLPAWGKRGEDYVLFSWTRKSWHEARTTKP